MVTQHEQQNHEGVIHSALAVWHLQCGVVNLATPQPPLWVLTYRVAGGLELLILFLA